MGKREQIFVKYYNIKYNILLLYTCGIRYDYQYISMSFTDSLKSLIIVSLIAFVAIRYVIVPEQKDSTFEISGTHVKFHSNWTESFEKIKHISDLHYALKLPTVTHLDVSFAMSSLSFDDIAKIFPLQLKPYKSIKLNLGNIDLGTKGAEYILSLIPNGVEELQIYFDSIKADNALGKILGQKLTELSSLKKVKISLILSSIKEEGFTDFFKYHKISPKLKDLRLVLIGNQLNQNALAGFKDYVKDSQLDSFGINLYANSIKAEGAKHLAEGLSTLKPKSLDIDLYFNNITEVGTKDICDSVSKITTLQKLSLNFDFNYIKNEGAKEIGQMLKTLPPLKQLTIGVASKNFGYLGFKSLIDGMAAQKQLTSLILRCGVNRVGINGASIVNKMLQGMQKLERLDIGFVQNYIGDQGISQMATTVATKLPNLKYLDLDVAFNDAKGYGGISALKQLASRKWESIEVRLSHNQFRDADIKLMKPHIKQLLKDNDHFVLEFMQTAVSRVMMAEIQKLFDKYGSENKKLYINSIIPEEQQKKAQMQASGEKVKETPRPKPEQTKKQAQTQKNGTQTTAQPKIQKVNKQQTKEKLKQKANTQQKKQTKNTEEQTKKQEEKKREQAKREDEKKKEQERKKAEQKEKQLKRKEQERVKKQQQKQQADKKKKQQAQNKLKQQELKKKEQKQKFERQEKQKKIQQQQQKQQQKKQQQRKQQQKKKQAQADLKQKAQSERREKERIAKQKEQQQAKKKEQLQKKIQEQNKKKQEQKKQQQKDEQQKKKQQAKRDQQTKKQKQAKERQQQERKNKEEQKKKQQQLQKQDKQQKLKAAQKEQEEKKSRQQQNRQKRKKHEDEVRKKKEEQKDNKEKKAKEDQKQQKGQKVEAIPQSANSQQNQKARSKQHAHTPSQEIKHKQDGSKEQL